MKPQEGSQKSSEISFSSALQNLKHLFAGGFSGSVARTITAPFERVAILKQTKNPHYLGLSTMQSVITIYKKEGFLSYFKGNGANVCRIFPYSAIELFTFEFYKQVVAKAALRFTENKPLIYFIAGSLAGMTASVVVYPFDVVRTLFAVQVDQKVYNGIISSWIKIIQTKGFLSLYRGIGITLLGYTPYASMRLSFFQLMKNKYYTPGTENSSLANLGFGAISGCLAVTLCYPVDLLRKKFQATLMKEQTTEKKISYGYMIRNIWQKEGFKGFYVGLAASYCKLIPATAIMFSLNEHLKKSWKIEK